jgi:valyl-tRNA synthetase
MSLNYNGVVVENKARYVNEQGGSKLTYNFVTDPRLKRGHNFGIIYVTSSNYDENTGTGTSQQRKNIQSDKNGIADDAVSAVIPEATIYMPFSDLVDVDKEIERLTKEKKRLEGELKRSHAMLTNEQFLSKAPAEKVAEEKEKLARYEDMMKKVDEELAHLQ